MEKIIELFTANPTQKEVHTTSDGYNFWDAHFAEAHARTLPNQEVTTTTRTEALAAKEPANKKKKADAKEPAAPATEPAKEPVKEEPSTPAETPNTEV